MGWGGGVGPGGIILSLKYDIIKVIQIYEICITMASHSRDKLKTSENEAFD